MKKLNLGCGLDVRKDCVNLDLVKLPGIDVVHDLNKFPYPFKENTFDEILCLNVLEHVRDFVKVLGELHRISKPDAIIVVSVPYWNSNLAWADPQHKRGFTLDTFTYFEKTSCPKGDKSYYAPFNFKVVRQRLIGNSLTKCLPEFLRRKVAFFLCNIGQGIEAKLRVVK